MNKFYSISENTNLLEGEYDLRNLGTQMVSVIIGGSRRSGWGERTSSSQTFYRETTSEDYDGLFADKLIRFKPIYEIEHILDHHLNYYINNTSEEKDTFIKHIKYVVLPLVSKKRNSEVQEELINNWIDKKMNPKENKDNPTVDIGTINAPTQIQINSNHSTQVQKNKYSNDDIFKFLKLIEKDLTGNNSQDSKDLIHEIENIKNRLEKGKDVKNRLLVVGDLIKDIGLGVFTNLAASPIFELMKPMIGM